MKTLLVLIAFSMSLGNVFSNTEPENDKKKNRKEKTSIKEKSFSVSKNFHSLKKWKITIEFVNGEVINKTITLNENSAISSMENAFMEAEMHLKTLKNVKSYNVSPVSNNSFVLLAEH